MSTSGYGSAIAIAWGVVPLHQSAAQYVSTRPLGQWVVHCAGAGGTLCWCIILLIVLVSDTMKM